ncbi:MAG TPA: PIG-L family deacetylase [Beutenbergiaceae bacterium]|nr:PIG-L family deacetylase [Beutenbergiaceae bacterium]
MAEQKETARPVVLGFFAHPDDETLSAGGVLALLAEQAEVHIVTATRGEMGEIVAPEGERTTPDRAQLPLTRSREVAQAAAELGACSHEFLDGGNGRYVDSGMAWEDERRIRAVPDPTAPADSFSRIDIEDPARALAQRIIALRPTLLLTEEPAGGYGHPDHIRCHDVAMRALDIAAESWRVPFVAFAVQHEGRVRAANAELARAPDLPQADAYGLPLHRPDLDAPLRTGVHEAPDVVLDTAAAADRLIGAMRAHRTQVHALETRPGEALAGWYALTNNDLKPIPTHAGLLLAPGWGTREGLASFLASLGAPIAAEHRGRPGRFYTGFLYIFALLSGIIVGFAGSFTHRANPPWGLVIGLVAVLAGAVMNRTTGSAKTAFTYAVGLVGSVLLITTVRTGGDVVVVEDALGLGWLVGIFVALFAGTLIGGGASGTAAAKRTQVGGGNAGN